MFHGSCERCSANSRTARSAAPPLGVLSAQDEALPEDVAKLQLGITLDDLTNFEEPPLERRLEARHVAIATANSNVFGRRKKLADGGSSDPASRTTPIGAPEGQTLFRASPAAKGVA
jgi:hypothetical protein